MQLYLTYLCTDINETGPSLVIFLRVDQFYVLRFLFCRVYKVGGSEEQSTSDLTDSTYKAFFFLITWFTDPPLLILAF